MLLEIIENEKKGYNVLIEGNLFRHCRTYSELSLTISGLIKSKFLGNVEGMIWYKFEI